MKNTLMLLVALFVCVSSFAQSTADDDNENGTSLIPILKDVAPVLDKLEGEGLEIVRMEIDIVKDSKSTSRVLHKGWSYGIAVVGDYRFANLDIKVYQQIDGNWQLIKEDTDADKSAVVIIEPSETTEYIIEIINTENVEGYSGGHYALLVFHE
ncbi:MAG: hypothetical protein HC803_06070 [Saprospiraceae bacterium]|nr:hypothetical protein [Saprospiraceae bacterium]